MTDRGLTLTTTVRVIAGVHDRTADGRADALMAGLTCLTDLNGIMLKVTDLTDGSLAIQPDDAHLAGGQTNLCNAAFLGDQLRHNAGGAGKLRALAGVQLNVVDEGTGGDIRHGQRVTDLDIGIRAGVDHIADLQTLRCDDVALGACLVLQQSDVGGTVGVVLDGDDGIGGVIRALEVNDTVLDLVTAASVTDGDAACFFLITTRLFSGVSLVMI